MKPGLFIADMDKIRVDAFLVTDPDAEDYKRWKREHPDSFSVPCRWVWRDAKTGAVEKASNRHEPFEPRPDDHGRGTDPDERPMRPISPLNPLPRSSPLPDSVLPPFPVLRPPLWAPRAPSVAPSGPAPSSPGRGGPAAGERPRPGGRAKRFLRATSIPRRPRSVAGCGRCWSVRGRSRLGRKRITLCRVADPCLVSGTLRMHNGPCVPLGSGSTVWKMGWPLSPAFHRRLHTADYYMYVRRQIVDAGSPDGVRAFLSLLGVRLGRADAEFQRTGQMPTWEDGGR